MEARLGQLAMHTKAHPVTSLLAPQIKAPCPLQGHRNPLTSGHSMVNVLFCSFVIQRFSVSSEMLEVPYGERNIIISLSSSCTHVLTELLKPQGLCSQSRRGKAAGNRAQKRVPRSLDSDSRDGTAHMHALSGYTQSTFADTWSPTVTAPRSHQDKCHILPQYR